VCIEGCVAPYCSNTCTTFGRSCQVQNSHQAIKALQLSECGYTRNVTPIARVEFFFLRRILMKIKSLKTVPSGIDIAISGFGNVNCPDSLWIHSTTDISLKIHRSVRPYFGGASESELQRTQKSLQFKTDKFNVWIRAKRYASLAIQSHKLSYAFRTGFKSKLFVSSQDILTVPAFFNRDGNKIWISRSASKSGFYNPELGAKLEFDFRRSTFKDGIFITEIQIWPAGSFWLFALRLFRHQDIFDLVAEFDDIDSALTLASLYPSWHYVHSFFTLKFNQNIFCATNIYPLLREPESNALMPDLSPADVTKALDLVAQNTDFDIIQIPDDAHLLGKFFLVDGKIVLPTKSNQVSENVNLFWPNEFWRSDNCDFIAVPNFLGEKLLTNSAIVIGNSGWGHFLEEEVPRFMLLKDPRGTTIKPICTYFYDKVQLEIIDGLMGEFPSALDSAFKYRLKSCSTVTLRNFRKEALAGCQEYFGADTLDLLKKFKSSNRFPKINIPLPERIYLARESGLFRNLYNKKQLEKLLEGFGFQKVYTTDMPLDERVSTFSNAKIIVAESGSGIFNAYFANREVCLIEIRHPDLLRSSESNLMLNVVGMRHFLLEGKRFGFLSKGNALRDNYFVEIEQLGSLLSSLIENVAPD